MELAIEEEKAKAAKINEPAEPVGGDSEGFRIIPHAAESVKKSAPVSEGDESKVSELEKEVMNLRILNKGKDFFIEQLKSERQGFFQPVVSANRKVGNSKTGCCNWGLLMKIHIFECGHSP